MRESCLNCDIGNAFIIFLSTLFLIINSMLNNKPMSKYEMPPLYSDQTASEAQNAVHAATEPFAIKKQHQTIVTFRQYARTCGSNEEPFIDLSASVANLKITVGSKKSVLPKKSSSIPFIITEYSFRKTVCCVKKQTSPAEISRKDAATGR